jgi:hypothetical protein
MMATGLANKIMNINLTQITGKEIRTLEYLWGTLCKNGKYILPETIEDLSNYSEFPTIKINGNKHYFTKELNNKFCEFVDKIYYQSTIIEYFSYNTIFQSVLYELEITIDLLRQNK